MGIKNMAKNLAPTLVVPVATAFPTAASNIKKKICKLRSPVLELVHVTQTEIKKVANHTGAVNHNVSIVPYPRVPTMLGKKYWNVWLSRDKCCSKTKRYSR